jgi:hypothetical protein
MALWHFSLVHAAKKTPFNLRFVSDHWEWSGTEAPKTPNGFKLIYTLKSC